MGVGRKGCRGGPSIGGCGSEAAGARAGFFGVFFTDAALHFTDCRRAQALRVEGCGAGQEFVEQHAE